MVKTWNLVFADLVEGDKNLEEESTKWGIFFGGRKRMSKLLASAGLFPIPCPIRENPPMLSQFGRELGNLMIILCKAFFHLSILLSLGAIL